MRQWIRGWVVYLRYGSPLTKQGRALRRRIRDFDINDYIEVRRP